MASVNNVYVTTISQIDLWSPVNAACIVRTDVVDSPARCLDKSSARTPCNVLNIEYLILICILCGYWNNIRIKNLLNVLIFFLENYLNLKKNKSWKYYDGFLVNVLVMFLKFWIINLNLIQCKRVIILYIQKKTSLF